MKSIWIARNLYGNLMGFKRKPTRNCEHFEWEMSVKEPFGMWELHAGWFPQLTWNNEPIELVIKENED